MVGIIFSLVLWHLGVNVATFTFFYHESEKFGGSLMKGFNSIWTILVQYVILNIPFNLCHVNSGRPKPEFTA